MEDFLDEREQWARVTSWLRQQGPWLVAGIAVAVAVLAGWRYWQARTDRRAQEAAGRYEQVIAAFSRSDFDGGFKLTAALASDYPSSAYADQAELAAARIEVEIMQPAKAVVRLQQVMQSSRDPQLALLARLRLARVQLDQNQPEAALATLGAAEPGGFAARYQEVRGDALLAKGDRDGALKAYRDAHAAAASGTDADRNARGKGAEAGSGSDAGADASSGVDAGNSEVLNTDLLDLKINALTHS